jgi:hypothetical protein
MTDEELEQAADDLIRYIHDCYHINYGDKHIAAMRDNVRKIIKEIYAAGSELKA